MHWRILATNLALLAPSVNAAAAFMRFACNQLLVERADPLGSPGMSPSPHLHQIVGGNAFNITMDPNTNLPAKSTCTSCTFTEDFSNYWTAVMYFRARNGTLKRVSQMANAGLAGQNGGMTVYYIAPYDGKTNVTAFRPGFRMIVGQPDSRKDETHDRGVQGLSFRCFNNNGFGGAPGTGGDTRSFPKEPCAGGIRANIYFPTCWDGKNLDSPNHQSHVAYPGDGNRNGGAACPASHPVRIPQLFMETMWDTRPLNNKAAEWPTNGDQPFVFSTGDHTGYGQHADYVFGWKDDSLQRAMNAGCGVKCPTLKTQSMSQANKCQQKRRLTENYEGWVPALPGNNQMR